MKNLRRILCISIAVFSIGATLGSESTWAQTNQVAQEGDPASALSEALSAACRENETQFASYLTSDNAVAFRALSSDDRKNLIKRFALMDDPGKPLLSSDAQNHTVITCQGPASGAEFHFGDVRVRDNLAFVQVTVSRERQTQFGLVRENGNWRILSLGLLLVDIPELSKEWANEAIEDKEDAIIKALQGLREAIERYDGAFGKLPESLAQLGPAEPGQISPEQASMVSKDLATGAVGGYHFRYRVVATADPKGATFELMATPDEYGKTGRRSFFMDGAGRIHAADKHGTLATSDDPELEAREAQ